MRRGNSLVGMLVVIAIIAILMVVFMRGGNVFGAPGTGSTRADGKGVTVLGAAMAKGEDTTCKSDLEQLRMSIGMLHDDSDDKWPATLQETKFPAQFYSCPIGKEPYQYNPETGKIKCVHPGHGKY